MCAILLSLIAFMLGRSRWRKTASAPYHPGHDSRWYADDPVTPSSGTMPFAVTSIGDREEAPRSPSTTTGAVISTMSESGGRVHIAESPTVSAPSPRHEDGGAVAELVRSPSGRLPPAYRSWEHEGEHSPPGVRVLVRSHVPDTQSRDQSITGDSPLASSPSSFGLDWKAGHSASSDGDARSNRVIPSRR
ncbi:hypothetical protein C8Q74DRAFT_899278 [Fomes fomentarius]|nr:hypothetical protein C8Q74DRAFT_899278 [Fomes fomentarius]